eukprot:351427-Chlamydomonas_euryale.AAC.6
MVGMACQTFNHTVSPWAGQAHAERQGEGGGEGEGGGSGRSRIRGGEGGEGGQISQVLSQPSTTVVYASGGGGEEISLGAFQRGQTHQPTSWCLRGLPGWQEAPKNAVGLGFLAARTVRETMLWTQDVGSGCTAYRKTSGHWRASSFCACHATTCAAPCFRPPSRKPPVSTSRPLPNRP